MTRRIGLFVALVTVLAAILAATRRLPRAARLSPQADGPPSAPSPEGGAPSAPDAPPAEASPAAGGAATLRGRVLAAADAAPVAGARIAVEGDEGGDAISGPDGAYVLEGLPAGRRSVVVRGPAHAPVAIEVDLSAGRGTERDVFLPGGATVEGRVLLADSPVAGAVVAEDGGVRSCVAGADGAYVLRGFAPGTVLLHVVAPGIPGHLRYVEVPVGHDRVPHDLVLDEPWEVPGVVLGPDGRPVDGARVAVRPTTLFDLGPHFDGGLRGPGTVAVSSAAGTFALRDVGNPSWDFVHWSSEPAGPRLWAWKDGVGLGFSERVGPEPGRTSEPVTIRIPPAVLVRGSVRDDAGAPRPGTVLALTMTELDPVGWYGELGVPPSRATADAEGRFVAHLQPGHWLVRARVDGCAAFEAWLPVPASDGEVPWEIVLARGGDLAGRVVDGEDRPLPGAEVLLSSCHADDARTRTGADGGFRIRAVPESCAQPWSLGSVSRLVVRAEGFLDLERTDVPPGELREPLRMQRAPAGGVTGRVLLEDGTTPARACRILVYRSVVGADAPSDAGANPFASAEVNDADGRFRVGGLGPGGWMVEARLGDRMVRARGVIVPESGDAPEQRLVLRPAARIQVRVRTTRGAPVAGAYVQLRPDPGVGDTGAARTEWADADGRTEFRGLPPGSYRIVIPQTPPLLLADHALRIDEGEEALATVEMVEGGGLDLRAEDAEGRLLRGARATLHGTGPGEDAEAPGARSYGIPDVVPLDAGVASVRGLRPGDYRIRFVAGDLGEVERTCTVREGETTTVRATFPSK
jgi:hypothetical protein